jgi:hypothetical protein
LAWDATTPDTLAASQLQSMHGTADAVAAHAATLKLQKYNALAATQIVMPIAVETMGVWKMEGLNFTRELERRISLLTSDPCETAFLQQRLSVAMQQGNAASCSGSLPPASQIAICDLAYRTHST